MMRLGKKVLRSANHVRYGTHDRFCLMSSEYARIERCLCQLEVDTMGWTYQESKIDRTIECYGQGWEVLT